MQGINLVFSLEMLTKVFSILLLFFLFFQPVLGVSPPWLKKEAYVKYEAKAAYIWFSDGTRTHERSLVAFKWECVNLEGNTAELNISVALNAAIQFSTRVYVNAENRSVTLLNGTYIGKTWLWLPANPAQNETIPLADNVTTRARVGGWMSTCQGAQKCFCVRVGGYDLDTGIPIQPVFDGDPTLRALGISEINNLNIAAINIDLGPREWLMDLILAVPYMLPFIAFAVILIFLIRRRQQKKKRKMAKTKTKHPTRSRREVA